MDDFKRATVLPLSKYTPQPQHCGYELVALSYPCHKLAGDEIHLISPRLDTATVTREQIERDGGSFDCFIEWLERTDQRMAA